MSVVSFQVKDGCENDFLDTVCASRMDQYLEFFGDSRIKASSGVVTTWANPNFD